MSAQSVLAAAMFKATDALMTNQPCVCGRPHEPATDCYMPGTRQVASGQVHIRQSASMATFCGQLGGSISLDHYQQNPSAHVSTLPLCGACHAGVDKHEHAMRRNAVEGSNHRCLPPRWPDTQDLHRCAWFGHRVAVSVRCCRYVLTCARCRKTLADLPRGEHGTGNSVVSLPLTVDFMGPPAPPPNTRIRRGIG